MDTTAIQNILEIQIDKLREIFAIRKLTLVPHSSFTADLALFYDPRKGVRGIINYLQTEATAQMGKLDRMGILKHISAVSIQMQAEENIEYKVDNDALTLYIKAPTS